MSQEEEEVTVELPPGRLGVDIEQRPARAAAGSSSGGGSKLECVVTSQSNPVSPLEVSEILLSIKGTVLSRENEAPEPNASLLDPATSTLVNDVDDGGQGSPESNRSTQSRKCSKQCNNILAIRVLLALLVTGVSALVGALLVIGLYVRTGTLTGRAGWHGNLMASILIGCAGYILVFSLIVFSRRRWLRRGAVLEKTKKDTHEHLPTIEDVKEVDLGESPSAVDECETGGIDVKSNATNGGTSPSKISDKKPLGARVKSVLVRIFLPDDEKAPAVQVKRFLIFFILPLTLAFLVIGEVVFILGVPTLSIFPLSSIGAQDAIASSPEGGWMLPTGCDVASSMEEVGDFFRNSTILDFDRVQVVVGGYLVHFGKFDNRPIGAHVIDEAIYLLPGRCPSVALLVHEMVHIWQLQSGWTFGSVGLRRVIREATKYRGCHKCKYDYGGPEGVKEMYDRAMRGDPVAADVTLAFETEQMAEIVEHYYLDYCAGNYGGFCWGIPSWDLTNWYYEEYKFYVQQILNR